MKFQAGDKDDKKKMKPGEKREYSSNGIVTKSKAKALKKMCK